MLAITQLKLDFQDDPTEGKFIDKTFTDSPVTNSINKTKPGSNRPGKFGYNLDRILSKYVIRAFRVDSGQHFSYTCSIRILSNLGDIIEKLMLPFRP